MSKLEKKWLRELEIMREGFITRGCSKDEAAHEAWIPFHVWLLYNRQIGRIKENDYVMRGEGNELV